MTVIAKAFAAVGSAALLLGACAAVSPAGDAVPRMMPSGDCFSSSQWRGWASPSDDILYLRVGNNDIYLVDLLPGSGGPLDRGGDFLISEVRGSSRICSANDLDLRIATTSGFATPLFPRAIRKLTPEEVAALPPNARP